MLVMLLPHRNSLIYRLKNSRYHEIGLTIGINGNKARTSTGATAERQHHWFKTIKGYREYSGGMRDGICVILSRIVNELKSHSDPEANFAMRGVLFDRKLCLFRVKAFPMSII